jgi:hypothetical protein
MVFLVFALICTLICWKSGKWRKWKDYYPTILFLYLADLVSDLVQSQMDLWSFNEITVKYPILDLALMALLYTTTAILFLSSSNVSLKKQILNILLWTSLYTIVEFAAFLIGDFKHYNGWNIYYSLLLNLVLFSLINLHYKRRYLLTWTISLVFACIFTWWFKIPLEVMH